LTDTFSVQTKIVCKPVLKVLTVTNFPAADRGRKPGLLSIIMI
jgi:hypothetical protein